MRFKKGDRVVVIVRNTYSSRYSNGDVGVVLKTQTDPNSGMWVKFSEELNDHPYLYENEAELYEIYHSPLYKALS